MVLYKAIEVLNLDDTDKMESSELFNKHLVLEESFSSCIINHKLKRKKKQHCNVIENQMFDLWKMESECEVVDIQKDTKDNLLHCVVTKMNTWKKCECWIGGNLIFWLMAQVDFLICVEYVVYTAVLHYAFVPICISWICSNMYVASK